MFETLYTNILNKYQKSRVIKVTVIYCKNFYLISRYLLNKL